MLENNVLRLKVSAISPKEEAFMKRHHTTLVALLALALVASTGPLAAQEPAASQPDNAQQQMMEAWLRLAAPGPNHKLLEPMVGSWSVAVTTWTAPGLPPEHSEGTQENAMVLGGRFLQQLASSTFMGEPFEGIGYTGYDNGKGVFVSTWMDSMGTMVMISTGNADESGKVMTLTGTLDDPVSGKPTTVREVVTVVDQDKYTVEMFGPGPDGKEFRTMEGVYTRSM
jgi:hypothetical protein